MHTQALERRKELMHQVIQLSENALEQMGPLAYLTFSYPMELLAYKSGERDICRKVIQKAKGMEEASGFSYTTNVTCVRMRGWGYWEGLELEATLLEEEGKWKEAAEMMEDLYLKVTVMGLKLFQLRFAMRAAKIFQKQELPKAADYFQLVENAIATFPEPCSTTRQASEALANYQKQQQVCSLL